MEKDEDIGKPVLLRLIKGTQLKGILEDRTSNFITVRDGSSLVTLPTSEIQNIEILQAQEIDGSFPRPTAKPTVRLLTQEEMNCFVIKSPADAVKAEAQHAPVIEIAGKMYYLYCNNEYQRYNTELYANDTIVLKARKTYEEAKKANDPIDWKDFIDTYSEYRYNDDLAAMLRKAKMHLPELELKETEEDLFAKELFDLPTEQQEEPQLGMLDLPEQDLPLDIEIDADSNETNIQTDNLNEILDSDADDGIFFDASVNKVKMKNPKVELKNGSAFEVKVYMEGPSRQQIALHPTSAKTITLVPGTYTIAAKSSDPKAKPYTTEQEYKAGKSYKALFYMTDSGLNPPQNSPLKNVNPIYLEDSDFGIQDTTK